MADSSIITTTKARPKLGQSAQAKWSRKKQKAGMCRACGDPRPPELAQHCRPCQVKQTEYMRKYRAKLKAKKENTNVDAGSGEAGSSNIA